MDNTREKLMKIVREKATELPGLGVSATQTLRFVDHLIANGVTVQGDKDINVPTKWISVKERLPKGGEIVLCNTEYFIEVLQWDKRADMWVDQYRSYRKNYVTHWMPLPEPPKGE